MSFVSDIRKGRKPKPQRAKAIELIKQQFEKGEFLDTKTIAFQTGYSQRQIQNLVKEIRNPSYSLKVKHLKKLIAELKKRGFQVEISKEAFTPEQIDGSIAECEKFLKR